MKYLIFFVFIYTVVGCSFSKDKTISPQNDLPVKKLSKQEIRREQLIRAVVSPSDVEFQNQIKNFTREELNETWENGSSLFDYLYGMGNVDRLKYCMDMGLSPYSNDDQIYLFDTLRKRASKKIGNSIKLQEENKSRTSIQIALNNLNTSIIDEIYGSLSLNIGKASLLAKSVSINCSSLSYSIFLRSLESNEVTFEAIMDFLKGLNCLDGKLKPFQASDLWLLAIQKEFKSEFKNTSFIKHLADNYSNLPTMIPAGDERILASIGLLYETSKICRFVDGEFNGTPNVLCAQQTGERTNDGPNEFLPSERYISYTGDPYSKAPTKTELFTSYLGERFSTKLDVIVLDNNGVFKTGTKCLRSCIDPNGSSELTTNSNFLSRSIYLGMHGFTPLRDIFRTNNL